MDKKINPVLKTFMIIMFILLLLTSIITFLYSLRLYLQNFGKPNGDIILPGSPLGNIILIMSISFMCIPIFYVLLQKYK